MGRFLFLLLLPFSLFAGQSPLVILVGGPSGAGKTALSQQLKDQFGDRITVISQDSYYHHRPQLSYEERKKLNFDIPEALDFDLLHKHLVDLKAGKAIEKPLYDFKDSLRNGSEVITPRPIILVEGLLVLAVKELSDIADLRVYVDCAHDVCLVRRIRRDLLEGRESSIERLLNQYMKSIHPGLIDYVAPSKKSADMIVHSNERMSFSMDVLKGFIENHLQQSDAAKAN